jgi:bacterioferritin-associated ferredoxin
VIVCVCRNVSDRQIAAALASGARDVAAVMRATGAGSGCGCCVPTLAAMIARAGPCSATPCPGCPLAPAAGAARRKAA